MSAVYDFLKPYMREKSRASQNGAVIYPRNSFYPVKKSEVISAENRLDMTFPTQLKDFYKQIGYGFLVSPHNPPKGYDFCNTNRINNPGIIVDILTEGSESGLISQDTYELLEPGDLPFFEIGDSSSFLVMRPISNTPNAVWSDCGVKIEDSFEKFIWRLYYESPGFYGDIILSHYKPFLDPS